MHLSMAETEEKSVERLKLQHDLKNWFFNSDIFQQAFVYRGEG
jgi:hypothetical protein